MGILLAALVVMAGSLYLGGTIEHRKRENFASDYCKRCGGKLKRSQRYGAVETTHLGGDRYAVRNDLIITEICTVCGNKTVK